MDIRTKEAVRYLGYENGAVDDHVMLLIKDAFTELERLAEPKFIYRIFELSFPDENIVQMEKLKIESKSLRKNLKGCKQAILLCATLGTEVDRQLRIWECADLTRAVVLQACAAAYLEEYLDQKQRELAKSFANEQKSLRPRFSPGYGDFSILHQKDVLQMMDAAKRIGLTMTESYMLTPTKSVTAIIGIRSV